MIEISKEDFQHIIKRLLDNAKDAKENWEKDKNNELASGVCEGYYEVLDTLKSELEVAGVDLAEIGFDIDLEKELL